MIITKLKGGLGNQMFQYAVGLFVASKENEELKMDATGYDDPRYVKANTPRQYRLFPFNISGNIATNEEVKKYKYPYGVFSKALRFFSQRILRRYYTDYDARFFKKKHFYVEGYFQSEKNFIGVAEKVRQEFTLKKEFESENFLTERNKIDKIKSVSVHIRRGDYISDKNNQNFYNTCSRSYYERAMETVKEKIDDPVFYFFSDDIEWVKKEFGESGDFHFVSNGKFEDYEELIFMSCCANNIIANSSFSWWAAWLNQNPNKIVIAPKRWVNKEPDPQPNIIPEGWIRV